ncbi:hypothetical protein ABH927_005869 [Planotetraspora sp. GP83]
MSTSRVPARLLPDEKAGERGQIFRTDDPAAPPGQIERRPSAAQGEQASGLLAVVFFVAGRGEPLGEPFGEADERHLLRHLELRQPEPITGDAQRIGNRGGDIARAVHAARPAAGHTGGGRPGSAYLALFLMRISVTTVTIATAASVTARILAVLYGRRPITSPVWAFTITFQLLPPWR